MSAAINQVKGGMAGRREGGGVVVSALLFHIKMRGSLMREEGGK